MIQMDIQSYCEDCPNFDPEVVSIRGTDGYVFTRVTCHCLDVCERIYERAKEDLKREHDDLQTP